MTAIANSSAASVGAASTSHDRRRTALNFLAMTGSSAISMIVGILISIFVRRIMGPVAIGQVNWNIAALSYLNLVPNPGLQAVGQREMAKDPAATEALTSLVLTLGMLLAVAGYGLVLVIAFLEPRGPEVSWLLIWQGLSLFTLGCNIEWVLKAHERMVALSIVSLAVNILQFPALILFVRGPEDVLIYAVCSLPFTLAGTAYNLWHLHRNGIVRFAQLRPTLAGAKALLSESWPFALSQAAVLVYWNSGTIILGFSHGDLAVGLYGTAARLIYMPTIISGAMLNAYYPVLSRMHGSPHEATRTAKEFVTLLAWMGLPLAALGWACGQHLVDLMYGPQFHEAGRYFEWLSLNVGLSFVNIGVGVPLLAWGHQMRYLKISASAAVANLALSLALIPLYGPWGAIGAAVFAEGLAFVLQVRVRHRLGLGWHPVIPTLLPPLACSVTVALAIAMIPEFLSRHWWLTTTLGTLALAGCVLVFERRILTAGLKLLRRP